MGAKKDPKLPEGFQRTEWIGTNGLQRLRITPKSSVKLNDGTWSAEIDFSATGTGSSGGVLSTCQEPGYWFGVNSTGLIGNVSLSERRTVRTSWSKTGRTDKIDGVVVHSSTFTQQFSNPGQLSMFAIPDGLNGNSWKYPAIVKLYLCKIYRSGKLFRLLIPCYRISDMEIGVYDVVGRNFYANVGTGTFEKGPDVNENVRIAS